MHFYTTNAIQLYIVIILKQLVYQLRNLGKLVVFRT